MASLLLICLFSFLCLSGSAHAREARVGSVIVQWRDAGTYPTASVTVRPARRGGTARVLVRVEERSAVSGAVTATARRVRVIRGRYRFRFAVGTNGERVRVSVASRDQTRSRSYTAPLICAAPRATLKSPSASITPGSSVAFTLTNDRSRCLRYSRAYRLEKLADDGNWVHLNSGQIFPADLRTLLGGTSADFFVYVPRDAAPGRYRVKTRVTGDANESLVVSDEFDLRPTAAHDAARPSHSD